jgi:hypothetical protein
MGGHFCIGHRPTSSTPSHSRTPARTRTHSRFRRLPFPSLRSRLLSQAGWQPGRLATILHRGYVNAFVDCLRAGWRLVWLARCQAKPSYTSHRRTRERSLLIQWWTSDWRPRAYVPSSKGQASSLICRPPSLLLQSILVSCLPTYLPTSWSTLVKLSFTLPLFLPPPSLPPFNHSSLPSKKTLSIAPPPRHKGTPTRSFDDTTTTS